MKSHTPQRNIKYPAVVSAFLIVIAVLSLAVSAMDIGIRILWQILTVTALVFSVQIMQRYLLTSYTYVVDHSPANVFYDEMNRVGALEEDDGLWLKIVRTQGKRSDVIGGFPLSAVVKCIDGRYKDLGDERSGIKHCYNYCNNIKCGKICTAVVIINGEKLTVTLECEKEFLTDK